MNDSAQSVSVVRTGWYPGVFVFPSLKSSTSMFVFVQIEQALKCRRFNASHLMTKCFLVLSAGCLSSFVRKKKVKEKKEAFRALNSGIYKEMRLRLW